MTSKTAWIAVVAAMVICAASAAFGDEAPAANANTSRIDEAAWLAGRWLGKGLGGEVEETWAPPRGKQMIGHFRLVRDGQPVFYELVLIEEHEGALRYRVKHFNPDMVGWEERDAWQEFKGIATSPTELRFDGLALLRVGDDECHHVLRMRNADGSAREVTLTYRRARDEHAAARASRTDATARRSGRAFR